MNASIPVLMLRLKTKLNKGIFVTQFNFLAFVTERLRRCLFSRVYDNVANFFKCFI